MSGEVPVRTMLGANSQSVAQINNSSNILNDITATEILSKGHGRNGGIGGSTGGGVGGTDLKKLIKDSG